MNLATREPINQRAGHQAPPAGSKGSDLGAISVSELAIRFGHGNIVAVEDFNLSIRPGEFVSIVGPSGCGKTTFLNCLAGLLPDGAAEGSVRINGHEPRVGDDQIAYMLARDALCPWRTALANAELGAEIRGVPRRQRRERAMDLLQRVGLKGFEGAYPKALSHGMRQRVALARTFALAAPVMLMDEPFGALDAQTKLQLQDVLLTLWQEQKSTVVFITHDLSEAVVMSDRVIVMSARPGRITADVPIRLGRPRSVRELQKNHEYHDLYSQLWEKLERGIS